MNALAPPSALPGPASAIAPAWPRGEILKAALVARCDRYSEATQTGRSLLSLALVRNPAMIQRIADGGEIGLGVYEDIRAGLDRLEALARIQDPGFQGHPWPTGDELRRSLIIRCEAYCAATGLPPTRLAAELGKTSTYLSRLTEPDTDMRLSNYDACMAALDALVERLEAFIASDREGRHGTEAEELSGQLAAPSAGHRDEGEALHRTDRDARSRDGGNESAA